VLLYGCESWCLTAEAITRLRNWQSMRFREMYMVDICLTIVCRITSVSLQKRTGVFSLEHYLATRSLLWAGHVARMSKSRSPKKLMLPLVPGPQIANRQDMAPRAVRPNATSSTSDKRARAAPRPPSTNGQPLQ
jgi:hypothetical protein